MGGKNAECFKALAHPNSRKVRRLERQTRREERRSQQGKMRHAKELLEAMRFFWFREQCIALQQTCSAFSLEDARALTRLYIDRNDKELDFLRSLRNPTAGRIKKIEALKTSEEDAFRSSKGIVIPDLTDAQHLEVLTEIWDGRPETFAAVPRISITQCCSPSVEVKEVASIGTSLADIEKVRTKAALVAPKSALKFQARMLTRAKSVKTTQSLEEAGKRCRERGAEQQQKRLKAGRKALLQSQRRLAPPAGVELKTMLEEDEEEL